MKFSPVLIKFLVAQLPLQLLLAPFLWSLSWSSLPTSQATPIWITAPSAKHQATESTCSNMSSKKPNRLQNYFPAKQSGSTSTASTMENTQDPDSQSSQGQRSYLQAASQTNPQANSQVGQSNSNPSANSGPSEDTKAPQSDLPDSSLQAKLLSRKKPPALSSLPHPTLKPPSPLPPKYHSLPSGKVHPPRDQPHLRSQMIYCHHTKGTNTKPALHL